MVRELIVIPKGVRDGEDYLGKDHIGFCFKINLLGRVALRGLGRGVWVRPGQDKISGFVVVEIEQVC